STTPQNVKATAGEGKVTITWSAVSGVTKYRVQRLNGTSWSTVNYPTATSYVDTNVTNGTTYKYRVLAYVDGVWGKVSSEASATPVKVTTPQNVKATAGEGKVTISWSAVDGATKYRVQRLNGTTWSTINYPTTTSYVDTNVTAGTAYKYRVLAYVDGAWSAVSVVVTATPN
ncbi:MAG: fibronectin type III domain-containing protein, partial [Oscillospiraceae bacterium]|nr:fibronectin type III domain-containing protein [Oscillospiraceae bacterium]